MNLSRQMAYGALGAILLPTILLGLPIAAALVTGRVFAFTLFLLMVGLLSCVGYAIGRVQGYRER